MQTCRVPSHTAMTKTILVPMDGSDQSEAAMHYAIENDPDADLRVLHVVDMTAVTTTAGPAVVLENQVATAAEQRAKSVFDRARELADEAGHRGNLETVTEDGMPTDVVVAHAEDVDEVVMGSHGRDGAARILMGSVAETVVRRAPVPVTVVR